MSTTDTVLAARGGRGRQLILALALLLPGALAVALACGAISMSPSELWQGLAATDNSQAELIIYSIRLPRALLAALMGATLAISGAAMQGLFRNPLADPSLIGVTAGASLGASIIIVAGPDFTQGYVGLSMISAAAFVGGVISVMVVYRLATSTTGTSVATMLLAGIAITALAGALGSLMEFFADNEMLRRISLWRMGGLDGADFRRVVIAAVVTTALLYALYSHAGELNALLLGESEARHLGIAVDRVKVALVVWVAVGVGTSVAMVGTIAFVGLVVPHIIRMLTGPDHRILLPASALAGATLLICADTLSRVVLAPMELPVGIITALIGVPFFISLLRRRHQFGMQP